MGRPEDPTAAHRDEPSLGRVNIRAGGIAFLVEVQDRLAGIGDHPLPVLVADVCIHQQ